MEARAFFRSQNKNANFDLVQAVCCQCCLLTHVPISIPTPIRIGAIVCPVSAREKEVRHESEAQVDYYRLVFGHDGPHHDLVARALDHERDHDALANRRHVGRSF